MLPEIRDNMEGKYGGSVEDDHCSQVARVSNIIDTAINIHKYNKPAAFIRPTPEHIPPLRIRRIRPSIAGRAPTGHFTHALKFISGIWGGNADLVRYYDFSYCKACFFYISSYKLKGAVPRFKPGTFCLKGLSRSY